MILVVCTWDTLLTDLRSFFLASTEHCKLFFNVPYNDYTTGLLACHDRITRNPIDTHVRERSGSVRDCLT